jgi:choline dehydrogenase
MTVTGRADYVVVGGGTAGCVLATRLSQDAGTSVVLVEAGPARGPAGVHRATVADAVALWGSSVDWAYRTTRQPGTCGRVHSWPSGRLLGGSSRIDAMVHLRGHRSSYDAWEAQGAVGWNYAALLPYFRLSERAEGRDPRVRGTEGPMRIETAVQPGALARALHRAALQAGHPESQDGSGATEGVSWTETNVVAGERQCAADAYLRPVLSRPNLTVLTDSLVRRLVFEGERCTGVEYSTDGHVRFVGADREVVLSAGTVGSATLLLRSGVGPARHLREVGVPVRADLPGVGENLHDHPLAWISYRARRPGATDHARSHVLTASAAGRDPDVLLRMHAVRLGPGWTNAGWGFTITFSAVTPASRGVLRLRDADPLARPLIDPAYLSRGRDVECMVSALRMARRIALAPALAPWRGPELLPGRDLDDEEARAFVRSTTGTSCHPVGTCRMGTDAFAVVDPHLRVRGLGGLRVADASVMPSVVSADTNATVLAVAERAAHLIAGTGEPP